MKHIDYRRIVLFIIFIVSISIMFKLTYHHLEPAHTVLTINDKSISDKQFNTMFSRKSRLQNRADFIHSVIIKELLIQEALKAGIPKEESFRLSVQAFYEQSLIKIIMDRKYASFQPEIDASMIDRYMALSDKTLDITLLTYKRLDDIAKGNIEKEEHIRLPFKRLSIEVKYDLLLLETGSPSSPSFSETDSTYSVFRLDKINTSEITTAHDENRDMVRQLLAEHTKELMITQWLDGLREHADVTLGATVDQSEQ